MLELPEAVMIAGQINAVMSGKRIVRAAANTSPHKFAWYTGDPADYNQRLAGKTIGKATPWAGAVEIGAEDRVLVISTAMHYHGVGEKLPAKHQLLLEFADQTAFTCTVQMWGCMLCFKDGEVLAFEGYQPAKHLPSPLSGGFNQAYFDSLMDENTPKLSAKAFLTTGQRIPGLGNGVLQDILWTARINPRRKMADLAPDELTALFDSVKSVLQRMVQRGGRDTEIDLFGCQGGYKTVLSKHTVGQPCPDCASVIRKEAYLGGSIYYCPGCQPV